MEPDPRPRRRFAGLLVEPSVRSRIAKHRLEQVVGRVLRLELLRVLGLPACAKEHEIAGPWRQLLAPERLLRAPAEGGLARRPLAAADNGFGKRLRLVDRRNRLWLQADLLARAVELRCVDRARQGHGNVEARG